MWRVRRDVGADLRRDLTSICDALPPGVDTEGPPPSVEPILARLDAAVSLSKVWMGPAFHFPLNIFRDPESVRVTQGNAEVLSPHLEEWLPDVEAGLPMAAILHEGQAVSVCCSAATTSRAHEAGVETHTDFRGRGYAARATASWARLVLDQGCVPLYSTSWENQASRVLARKLRLVQYGSTFHAT